MSTGDDTTSSSHVTSENVQQSIAQFCNQYEQLKQENTKIQKLYDEINKLKTEKVALMQTLNDSQNECKVFQNKYDILLGKFKNISESNVDFDASLFDPDHFPKSYKECNIDQIVCIVECFILPTSQLNNKYKPKVIEWFKTNQMDGMNISNNIACDEEEIIVFSSDDDEEDDSDHDLEDSLSTKKRYLRAFQKRYANVQERPGRRLASDIGLPIHEAEYLLELFSAIIAFDLEKNIRSKVYQYHQSQQLKDYCASQYKNTAINIGIGHCGTALSLAFFSSLQKEVINDEEKSQKQLNQKRNTFYRWYNINTPIARNLIFDLDPNTIELIKECDIQAVKSHFSKDNFCFGDCETGTNFAKGFFEYGDDLIDSCVESFRKEVENHDRPQAIQILHSLGGGTGSGFTSLFMQRVKDDYQKIVMHNFVVFPSEKVKNHDLPPMIEGYNTVLALNKINEFSSAIFVMNNEALFNIVRKVKQINKPTLKHLNTISKSMINDVTSLFRYGVQDYNGFTNRMVNYAKLKYLSFARVPMKKKSNICILDRTELVWELFSPHHMLYSGVDLRKGTNLSTTITFRGTQQKNEGYEGIDQALHSYAWSDRKAFILDQNIVYKSIKCKAIGNVKQSAMMITNTTSITQLFRRITRECDKFYKRRAFFHWYRDAGMEVTEFKIARDSIEEVVVKYDAINSVCRDAEESK
eukprot:791265_1